MEITLIAAMAKQRVIGVNNQLPWHLPKDLAHFKQLTLNKPVIMGRKTFESIGRPLPKRDNIVLTRNPSFQADNVFVFHDLHAAIQAYQQVPEVMIIGGAYLYQQALPIATRMQLTIIDAEFAGDSFFPEWDENEWRQVSQETLAQDADNPFTLSFVTLERHR